MCDINKCTYTYTYLIKQTSGGSRRVIPRVASYTAWSLYIYGQNRSGAESPKKKPLRGWNFWVRKCGSSCLPRTVRRRILRLNYIVFNWLSWLNDRCGEASIYTYAWACAYVHLAMRINFLFFFKNTHHASVAVYLHNLRCSSAMVFLLPLQLVSHTFSVYKYI